jgi:octaprenyl-diphosphate synthase
MNQTTSTARPLDDDAGTIEAVLDLCSADMREVDRCIRASLASDVVLINQISEYIIAGGGKRFRPMLVVLSAHACGYGGVRHIPLAAIIEFIHTATLLHDDVVDESEMRRGKEAAHAVWGNAASVLVGDFLYSRSFQMMVGVDSMRVMEILAETTNTIAEGEVLQLLNLGDPEVDERRYLKVISDKTAKLFEAACRLGAVLAGLDGETEAALARYGNQLGCAFQVADDVLDYTGADETLGKRVGDDLAEGKPTLPLIVARSRADADERRVIDAAIREGGLDRLDQILAIIDRTGALTSARERAEKMADAAVDALAAVGPSPWRSALETLAGYAVRRSR